MNGRLTAEKRKAVSQPSSPEEPQLAADQVKRGPGRPRGSKNSKSAKQQNRNQDESSLEAIRMSAQEIANLLGPHLKGISDKLETLTTEVNAKLDLLTSNQQIVNNRLDSVESRLDNLEGSAASSNQIDLTVEAAELIQRQNNFILWNLKESSSDNLASHKEHDLQLVQKLFNDLNISDGFVSCYRKGRWEKEKAETKPRPLVIKNSNSEIVKDVFRRFLSKNFTTQRSTFWNNVQIDNDLTVAQQQLKKNLRKEVEDDRAQNINSSVRISGFRVYKFVKNPSSGSNAIPMDTNRSQNPRQ